jgi:predicted RecB family nuclease
MFSKITEKTFYQYIKCPTWVYFDVHENETRLHNALQARLVDDGLLEENELEIISDREDVAKVTAEDPEEAYRQTLGFMREGRQTIYRGVLVDKHWVGHPDILEKVEGKSHLGEYYYIAADMKRSRYLRDDFKFQGCFYAELLEKVQGVKPVQGYVLNPDKEAMEYLIEDFESEYKLTLSEIEKIIAGQKPTHFVTSGCKQSPWFKKCHGQSEECDDLSLLNRVWREEVTRLNKAGIKTIADLALKSVADLEKVAVDVNPHRLEIMRDQAVAITENRNIIRHTVDMPESSIELYFDIESDPLRDFNYLFGVLKVTEEGQEYHQFFAESPDQEANMWKEFVEFIEQHLDVPVYHYGYFEQEVVQRFSQKYGASELVKDSFVRNFIDLIELVRPAVVFPLSFYSLKDIATYIGFEWRSKDASGANSVLWFEEWLETKSPMLLKKIVEYNEDDVIATYKLQRWLSENT